MKARQVKVRKVKARLVKARQVSNTGYRLSSIWLTCGRLPPNPARGTATMVGS